MNPETGGYTPPEATPPPDMFKHQPPPETPEVPVDFKFHQTRFDRAARKLNKKDSRLRNVVEKAFDIPDETALGVAQTEANLDNKDFNERKSAEFAEWERKLKIVIDHIKSKIDDPEGEGKNRRILVYGLGGGTRGPYTGAQLAGMEASGYPVTEVADVVVASSAAAIASASALGGIESIRRGTALALEKIEDPSFINPKRLKQILDLGYLIGEMKSGENPLDIDAILQSKPEFHTIATNRETGQPEFLDVKTAKPGPLDAIKASAALPVIFGEPVNVNGVEYFDGDLKNMPIEEIIARFNPTDILILPTMPFDPIDELEMTNGEKIMQALIPNIGQIGKLKELLDNRIEMRRALEYINKQTGVNIAVMWPPDGYLGNLNTDAWPVEAAMMETLKDTIEKFGGEQPKSAYEYLFPGKRITPLHD